MVRVFEYYVSSNNKLEFTAEAELRKPKIREPLQDTETTKKNKTILSCVITGDPVPDITWYIFYY